MTENLIEKFFNKQCTPAEAEQVTRYLKDHPEVVEKYLGTTEWFSADSRTMSDEFWTANWAEIMRRRSTTTRRTWWKVAAAAAVIIVGIGVLHHNGRINPPMPHASTAQAQPASQSKKIIANTTDIAMKILLPDGSTVVLSSRSVITYPVPQANDKREITLDGEGRFSVVKNDRKPFTVYAGGLATTALGTEFTINTNNNVSVKLHNGRVLIRATGELARHWKKDVILEPGEQLNYSEKEMTASVEKIQVEKHAARKLPAIKPKKIADENAGMNFVNAALPDVMRKLMDHYHQPIDFDSTGISRMNFTGTISENDSLPVVLKIIAQMNDLQLEQTAEGYSLKKARE